MQVPLLVPEHHNLLQGLEPLKHSARETLNDLTAQRTRLVDAGMLLYVLPCPHRCPYERLQIGWECHLARKGGMCPTLTDRG